MNSDISEQLAIELAREKFGKDVVIRQELCKGGRYFVVEVRTPSVGYGFIPSVMGTGQTIANALENAGVMIVES